MRGATRSSSLNDTMNQSPSYYNKESCRYTAITQKLAIFVVATNVPFSLFDNEEFRELLHEIDRRYEVPHRKVISQEIDKEFIHLKDKILSLFSNAVKISMCADIWSKPGMTASFLGVTAHFFYA